MAGYIYGVMTLDPITGKPAEFNVDADWSLGTAATVASVGGGVVVRAPRGEWEIAPKDEVEQAYEESRDEALASEMNNPNFLKGPTDG